MPLKKGSSDATVSKNIATIVEEYAENGAIGTSHPQSKKKAVKQAVAIALKTAGRARSKTSK